SAPTTSRARKALRRWSPEGYSTCLSSRESQRDVQFAAHRGVGGKTRHKVHRRIQARTHHEVRTQDCPACSILLRPSSCNVFLLVIMNRRNQTRLSFFCRGIEGTETESIGFGAACEHNALEWDVARGEGIERIF